MSTSGYNVIPETSTYCYNQWWCQGADTYARDFAKIHGIELIEFLPQYDKFPSKVAPLMRNKLIVENCDCLLAFWDGVSRGTKYTLDYANQLHKPIKIVNYKTNEITLINHKQKLPQTEKASLN